MVTSRSPHSAGSSDVPKAIHTHGPNATLRVFLRYNGVHGETGPRNGEGSRTLKDHRAERHGNGARIRGMG